MERLRLPAHRPARRSRPLLLGTQWTLAALLLALGAAGMAGGARALALTGGAWVAAALLLAALAASVGDVVCDGFAIDQLPRHQHGWGNVVQAGGSYAGAMLGSGGFLLAVQEPPRAWTHGPSDAEPDAPESAPTDAPENGVCRWSRPSLLYALRRPPVRQGLLRVVLCMAGLRLTMGLLSPLLLDAGVDMSQLGWLLGAFSLLAGLAGTLAGGLLVRRAPGWRAVWLALAAQAALLAALAALAAAAPAHPAFLPGLTGLMGLFFASAGCLWVALYAVLMQAASPLQPGVDFSLFQSADALVAVAGGWLAQHGGYGLCLAGATLLAAAGAWLLARQDAAAPRAQIQQIH
ncbi:MAG: hypothetical protein ACTTJV_02550 [Ottowia sp.]